MTQHLLKNKIDLRTSYSAQPIWVQGNEGRLHQVFLNVLINAMQAIDKEGVIELATIVVDGVLELKVSDNGSGISVEHIEKIMDPFFTTKAPGEGTGLGLAIVYNILKDHGGSISYSSEVGAGTTATIRIPALVQLA